MEVLIIDGQGGGLGRQLVAAVKTRCPRVTVLAVGTNHRITGARWTHTGPARAFGSGKKVLELEVEVW